MLLTFPAWPLSYNWYYWEGKNNIVTLNWRIVDHDDNIFHSTFFCFAGAICISVRRVDWVRVVGKALILSPNCCRSCPAFADQVVAPTRRHLRSCNSCRCNCNLNANMDEYVHFYTSVFVIRKFIIHQFQTTICKVKFTNWKLQTTFAN